MSSDELVHGGIVGDPVPCSSLSLKRMAWVGLVALNLEPGGASTGWNRAGNLVLAARSRSSYLVLDGSTGNGKFEIGVHLPSSFGERELGLRVDLPAPLLGAIGRDQLNSLHLICGDDIEVQGHSRENSALQWVTRRLSLACSKVMTPRRVSHNDVDCRSRDELDNEDRGLGATLLD